MRREHTGRRREEENPKDCDRSSKHPQRSREQEQPCLSDQLLQRRWAEFPTEPCIQNQFKRDVSLNSSSTLVKTGKKYGVTGWCYHRHKREKMTLKSRLTLGMAFCQSRKEPQWWLPLLVLRPQKESTVLPAALAPTLSGTDLKSAAHP